MNNNLISISEPKEKRDWDNFIITTKQYSIFSSTFWLEQLCAIMGAESKYLICYKGGQPVAGVALCVVKKAEGLVVRPPVLTAYNTVHITDKEASYNYKKEHWRNFIIGSIAEYLSKNYSVITLVNHPDIADVRPFQWLGWQTIARYTYSIDCSEGNKKINFSPDLERRAKIAKAQGVSVRPTEDFEQFFILWKESLLAQNTILPMNQSNFMKLMINLKMSGKVKAWAAYNHLGEMSSACVFLFEDGKAYYWLAGNDKHSSGAGANQLLLQTILQEISSYVRSVDFMGADLPSVAYYKSTFGGDLIQHYEVRGVTTLRAKAICFGKSFLKKTLRLNA